jgi:hypothetical protein
MPSGVDRYDPDLWTDEFAFLNRPGQADIQSDLFYDYRTNVVAYPKWQAWVQKTQPRLLFHCASARPLMTPGASIDRVQLRTPQSSPGRAIHTIVQ